MSRVVSPHVSDFYQLEHANQGVKLMLSKPASRRSKASAQTQVGLDRQTGKTIPYRPRCGWRRHSAKYRTGGGRGSRGEQRHCGQRHSVRTADPDVYAIGDCTIPSRMAIYGSGRCGWSPCTMLWSKRKLPLSNICGIAIALLPGPLVLVRPVRPQATNRRLVTGIRSSGAAWRPGQPEFCLSVL